MGRGLREGGATRGRKGKTNSVYFPSCVESSFKYIMYIHIIYIYIIYTYMCILYIIYIHTYIYTVPPEDLSSI